MLLLTGAPYLCPDSTHSLAGAADMPSPGNHTTRAALRTSIHLRTDKAGAAAENPWFWQGTARQ
jgi:hypothetical protein